MVNETAIPATKPPIRPPDPGNFGVRIGRGQGGCEAVIGPSVGPSRFPPGPVGSSHL